MANLQTSLLLQKTEEAIQSFLKDDLEHNLPLINNLEEISYKLWKENISAFLEDDVVFSDEEQEDWFWDEEVFYETRFSLATESPYRDQLTYISDADSNYSSFVESSVTDSAMRSGGYLTSCESTQSESSFHEQPSASNDDWIVITNELSCTEDSNWLLVSMSTDQEQFQESRDSDLEESGDWMVMTMKVESSPWICDGFNFKRKEQTHNMDSTSFSKSHLHGGGGIRRRLFLTPDSESSFNSDGSLMQEDFQTNNIRKCANMVSSVLSNRTVTDVKERNLEWSNIFKSKANTEKLCHKSRSRRGQLSPGNMPVFASVT